jgi:hypothetical protein
MEPGYVTTESENRYAVSVEEPPYANMVANAPNANPVADPRIVNMTSFVARVSLAHQRYPASIVIWSTWVALCLNGNPTAFGAIVCFIQTKTFHDDFV